MCVCVHVQIMNDKHEVEQKIIIFVQPKITINAYSKLATSASALTHIIGPRNMWFTCTNLVIQTNKCYL